ncbi:MAG: hypothetical protein IJL76_00635 [Bacilli bacterium]|nr:hypothetical protein [Bacilli bacterium]
MKLKKKTKRVLIFLLIVLIVIVGLCIYTKFFSNSPTKVKKVDSIPKYGYNLKSTHPEEYKKLFSELKEILSEESVNKEAYAKKISQMFIYDFFSLDYKVAKTDVGGVEFINPYIEENFLEAAENEYYKYVESNIYGNRDQDLPRVTKPVVDSIDQISYKYTITKNKRDYEQTDQKAYKVVVKWDYTKSSFDDYQKEGTLVLINHGKKLDIVELQEETK